MSDLISRQSAIEAMVKHFETDAELKGCDINTYWNPAHVLSVLEETSPELVSDISETGITLTGGASQIWGMDLLLQERTGISCTVADDPASCVALGCGKSLRWITKMTEGPINIARKRLMRSNL